MNTTANGSIASSIAATWVKSSFSGPQGNCVEVARLDDGRVAMRSVRLGCISGSAVSAARAAARAPAASPSKHSVGASDRRQSSSNCPAVSAVPRGATAPANPAWCSAITSI